MVETRKVLILIGIIVCLFMGIMSASATDYYVNKDTTQKNIKDWMKKNAKKGDNLIFNCSSYDLNDTLVINKSINIKSYKNTKINFNKPKNMFNVKVNSVNFSGLRLIHKPNEVINYSYYDSDNFPRAYEISSIHVIKKVTKLNLKKMNIFADINVKVLYVPLKPNDDGTYEDPYYEDPYYEDLYYSAINIHKWNGNLKNCHLKINNGEGIRVFKWIGNLTNCNIKTTKYSGIHTNGLIGNIVNSKFESKGEDIKCIGIWGTFNGDIKNSKFSVQGRETTGVFIQWRWNGNFIKSIITSQGRFTSGLVTRLWTGTISKSKISSKGNWACSLYNWGWWKINIKNSQFTSNGNESKTIHSDSGTCKISKTKIFGYGLASKKYSKEFPTAVELFDSKGTISHSIIKQKNGYALKIPDDVKVNKCKISSKKGLKKIFRFKADLKVKNVSKSKNTYTITVNNIGDSSSKACYLSFKTKNVYKIAKISKILLEPVSGPTPVEIKINIPKKYANNYYTKTIKLDIYNQNKEHNKKNNVYQFKF